jgi:nitrate/nitrite transport system substrate-binding protein
MKLSRRELLRELMFAGLSLSAASAVLAGCGGQNADNTAADSSGSTASAGAAVKIGFISLTDCASVVVAQEMGLFKKHGVEVEVLKQPNWLAVRERLSSGELDASHCLFGMPFSVASGVFKGQGDPMKIAMILNNNGQATTLANKSFEGIRYADFGALKGVTDKMLASGKPADFRHDVSWRHPRYVDPSLARGGGHQPEIGADQGDAAAANGGQHDGGQHGRLQRRRTLGRQSGGR